MPGQRSRTLWTVSSPDDNAGSHGYWEWQVSTLMLAYDAIEPIGRLDVEAQQQRQKDVEEEVRELSLAQIPPSYHEDETRELTPDVVIKLTRATLRRAVEIVER
jgi:hypothetical protein